MGFVDISTLGKRTVTTQKVMPVEIDPITKMVMIKPVMVTSEVIQPVLNLEEAKLLEGVQWEPMVTDPMPEPPMYFCKVSGRRFLIDTKTYEALTGEQKVYTNEIATPGNLTTVDRSGKVTTKKVGK